MKRFLMWLVWRVPLGILAPWVLGLVIGRMPHKAEEGKWHCFDLPFMLICGDKPTAEKVVKILSAYDWSKAKQALQISWER